MGNDGLARLLHYPWPGGFIELQDQLKVIREKLDAGESIDDAALKALLAQRGGDDVEFGDGLDLTAFLMRRQREYIHLHREAGEDLKDTVLRLGIDSDSVSVDDVLSNNQLAFPEVVAQS